jgi:hypothetical protein
MKINIYTPVARIRRIKFAATQTNFACADYGKIKIFQRIKFAATQTKSVGADCGKINILKSCLGERRFACLILTCSLFLCLSTSFMPSAVAAPSYVGYVAQNMEASSQSDRLPPKVAKAVLANLAKLQKIPPAKLKVVKYSQESWSDGCLGLPQPEEICSQAIVEGWRVVVSDGSQQWIYRTDDSGRNIRLETPNATAESS